MAKEMNVERLKKKLLAERERLLMEARAIADRSRPQDESEELGELSDYDNHPADMGTETFEREKEFALDENIDNMIGQIDEALRKIEEGSYGKCDRCGRDISPQRLEALPYATMCIDCQDKVEGP